MQPDNLTKIRKLEKQLMATVFLLFILIIGFLAMYDSGSKEALALSGAYTSKTGLTAADWSNLPNDFVAKSGDIITGSLGVNLLSTDVASHELVVKDTSGGPSVYIWGSSQNAELALGDGTSHWGIYSDEVSSKDLRFWRGSDKMVITDDGKVGIGTDTSNPSAPYARLHVSGGNFYVTDNGNSPFILLGDSQAGGEFGLLKWDSTNDKLHLGTSAGGDTITINESGNVGIGVPDPQAKLEVNGRIFGKLGSGVGDWTTYTDQQWDSCGNTDTCRDKQTKVCNDGEYVCGVRILNDHRSSDDEDTVQLSVKCCKMTQ